MPEQWGGEVNRFQGSLKKTWGDLGFFYALPLPFFYFFDSITNHTWIHWSVWSVWMTSWTSVRAIRKKLPIDICHEIPNQCFLGGRIRLGISPARLTSANKILALYLESPHIHKLVQSVLLQYNPKCSNTMPLTVIVFFFTNMIEAFASLVIQPQTARKNELVSKQPNLHICRCN